MSTPQSASKKKKKKTTFRLSSSAAGAGTQDDAIFTDDMRDRQARGKDPYAYGSEDDDDDNDGEIMRFGDARADKERFRAVEQRRIAAQILGDPELLMMYAMSRQDSIPGTRLHFMRVLCGQAEKEEPQSRRRGAPGSAQRRGKGS